MVLLVRKPEGHAVIHRLKTSQAKPQLTNTLQTGGGSVYKIIHLALETVALLRTFQKGMNFIREKAELFQVTHHILLGRGFQGLDHIKPVPAAQALHILIANITISLRRKAPFHSIVGRHI